MYTSYKLVRASSKLARDPGDTLTTPVQVMDDNKMLTLASNERIPLTGTMRLLLEINHMNHCSPATVSRGGVVFVNAEDVGWRPPVESWMSSLEVTEYRPLLSALFDRYADVSMDYCRKCAPPPHILAAAPRCSLTNRHIPEEDLKAESGRFTEQRGGQFKVSPTQGEPHCSRRAARTTVSLTLSTLVLLRELVAFAVSDACCPT